jgi:membrane-bound serine protease (ClpP class)
MHVSLGFLIGVLIAVGAFLVYVAVVGISFIGLAAADETVLAVTLFVVAAILVLIFAQGFRAQFRHVKTGREALIGAVGIATSDLNPKGEVRVMSEFWEATANKNIAAGQIIKVVGMDGLTLVVAAVEQKA